MDDLVDMGKYIKLLQYSEPELIHQHWIINFQ
jgi:hypothetical protein